MQIITHNCVKIKRNQTIFYPLLFDFLISLKATKRFKINKQIYSF